MRRNNLRAADERKPIPDFNITMSPYWLRGGMGDEVNTHEYTQTQTSRNWEPERKLAFAIIEYTVSVLTATPKIGFNSRQDARRCTERAEARDWVGSTDETWVFSFVNCWRWCFPDWPVDKAREMLLEHPEQIAEALKQIKEQKYAGKVWYGSKRREL